MMIRFLFAKIKEAIAIPFFFPFYLYGYFFSRSEDHIGMGAEEELQHHGKWVNWAAGHDEESWYDRWYGLYELYDIFDNMGKLVWYRDASGLKRLWASIRWYFRNPSWGFKKEIAKHLIGEKTDIKTRGGGRDYIEGSLRWMNQKWHGWQYATFKVNRRRMFRFSFTVVLLGLYWNIMIGAGEDRYILKNRGAWGYIILLMMAASVTLIMASK